MTRLTDEPISFSEYSHDMAELSDHAASIIRQLRERLDAATRERDLLIIAATIKDPKSYIALPRHLLVIGPDEYQINAAHYADTDEIRFWASKKAGN